MSRAAPATSSILTLARSSVRPVARSLRCSPAKSRSAPNSANSFSTSAASESSSSASTSPARDTTRNGRLPISWPTYFRMRARRNVLATAFTIPSTTLGLFGGAAYFGNKEMTPGAETIMGMDPIWVYGGATLGCMGMGYLLGPILGTSAWKLVNRSKLQAMDVMDKEFYSHIKARRVDPSFQSVNNPTPDYYGEKINSLRSYRRWLRDCQAYKRKALHGLAEAEQGL